MSHTSTSTQEPSLLGSPSTWIAIILIAVIALITARAVYGVYEYNREARDFRSEHGLHFVVVVYKDDEDKTSAKVAGNSFKCEINDSDLPSFNLDAIMTAAIKKFGNAHMIALGHLTNCAIAKRGAFSDQLSASHGRRAQNE